MSNIGKYLVILLAVIVLAFTPFLASANFGIQYASNLNQGNINSKWAFSGQNQQNTWYSPQTMINPANAGDLYQKWIVNLPNVYGPAVVVNGTIYVTAGGYAGAGAGTIYAISEATGSVIWQDGENHTTNLDFITRGGVAVDSGSVYAGTSNNTLVSLDAKTGYLNWQVSITKGITGNPTYYYIGPSGSPLVYNDEIIIGDTQGDSGSRGFLRAFNETTGSLLWTWYVVPPSPITSSDQAAWGDTWGNCVYCGGGDIWSLPAVDPSTGILYVGTGNPAPDFNSTQRCQTSSEVNLYTASVVALDARTGQLIWYYQEMPCDPHDWDQGMPVAVFNATINGANTKVVGAGGKDGFYYELNAQDGNLIRKIALGIHYNYNGVPTSQGTIVYPGSFGGVNSYSSFNPMTNLIYTIAYNQPSNYTVGPVNFDGGNAQGSVDNPMPGVPINSTLYAIDASNGSIIWTKFLNGLAGGVSSTNNLVFSSDGDGEFYAFNAETGQLLWTYLGSGGSFLGFSSRTPPSIVDGLVLETEYGQNGGVLAFTSNTSIIETSYPTTSSSTTTTSKVSTTTESSTQSSFADGRVTTTAVANISSSSQNANKAPLPSEVFVVSAITIFSFVMIAFFLKRRF